MSSFFKQIFYCEKVGKILYFDGPMVKPDNRFCPIIFDRKRARKRCNKNSSMIESLLYTVRRRGPSIIDNRNSYWKFPAMFSRDFFGWSYTLPGAR
jgi:hypothetical protein